MARTLVLVAVVLAAAAVPAAAQAAAPGKPAAPAGPSTPPRLDATLQTCATSPLPVDRIASFVGSMPARANTRMRMRFDLERRRPGERRYRTLRAPGFGVWQRADPGVAGFVVTKRVVGLPVPAIYRAVVRFRWLTARGAAIRRSIARTEACRQPDLRPDLRPGALSAALDLQPGLATYTLVVRNTGRSAAGPFSVRVGSGSAEVGELRPGEQRPVSVPAVVCVPGMPIVVRVDADRRVDEADERGNVARRRCPVPLG